jgi:hypothetical protein
VSARGGGWRTQRALRGAMAALLLGAGARLPAAGGLEEGLEAGPAAPLVPPVFGLEAEPLLPLGGLYAAGAGQPAYLPERPRFNFDFAAGPFFPLEGDESFDVGGTFAFKFQGEVARSLFLGIEFAFAGHDKDAGDLLSDGMVSRFFFLFPIEVDLPLGRREESPPSLRLGVAPGLQVADPSIDRDLDDRLFLQGLDLDEETMVAFNLRARLAARFPVGPFFGFIVEAAYDWAEARGKARLTNFLTGESESVRRHVGLSAVSLFFGIQTLF